MPKLMYDSVDASSIPADAEVVAGYGDGSISQWSSDDWARFPNAIALSIVVNPADSGDVLDVERGDASPGDCPGWIARYDRPVFKVPTIYCNRSNRAAIEAACQGLTYDLWVATLDGTTDEPGAAAVQYQNTPGYDVSLCSSWWPRMPAGSAQDTVTGVSVGGAVYDPTGQGQAQHWLDWNTLQPVGSLIGAGTGVTWSEAKQVDGIWYDRIERADGSPGDWCLPDASVDDGGFDPPHFRPAASPPPAPPPEQAPALPPAPPPVPEPAPPPVPEFPAPEPVPPPPTDPAPTPAPSLPSAPAPDPLQSFIEGGIAALEELLAKFRRLGKG